MEHRKSAESIVSGVPPSSIAGWSVDTAMAASAKSLWRREQAINEAATLKATKKVVDLEEECKRLRDELCAAKKRPRDGHKLVLHVPARLDNKFLWSIAQHILSHDDLLPVSPVHHRAPILMHITST